MNKQKHMNKQEQTCRAVGVIPARWGSTRFPGKSLALIAGKPLILWVLERARQARALDDLLVATDDERIQRVVEAAGCRVVMTRSDHPSGTDRIAEAVQGIQADVVVNIQGDEPLIEPALIDELAGVLKSGASWDMATAASPIRSTEERDSPAVVKVVWDHEGRALYFSRSLIPFERDVPALPRKAPLHWRHIGIYGYRRAFLEQLVRHPPCVLEEAEKLEQLRALHLGARIKVLQTESFGLGVDLPEDVAKAEKLLCQAASSSDGAGRTVKPAAL